MATAAIVAVTAAASAWPVGAAAGTVTVRLVKPYADLTLDTNEVFYAAEPGESNDVLVRYAGDAQTVTVTDRRAVVTATGPCSSVDPHTAVCRVLDLAAGPYLQRTRVVLGDRADHVATTRPTPYSIGGVIADGGPGDDRLDGGPGDDVLDGGGGRDRLRGGEDGDILTDGDRSVHSGPRRPDADLLDGGAGADTISYSQRTGPVTVDLTDSRPNGEPGESDELRGFERIVGGSGDDRLYGGEPVERMSGHAGNDLLSARDGLIGFLYGGPGADRLLGSAGPDFLHGGPGTDSYACGARRDEVDVPVRAEMLPFDCERIRFPVRAMDGGEWILAPQPIAVKAKSAVFRLRCPDLWLADEVSEAVNCRGTLVLRHAYGDRRLLGRVRFADRGTDRPFRVRVAFRPAGRSLAGRGVAATAAIHGSIGVGGFGRDPGSAAWRIWLKI
jgi:hypothetical protein